ncbi:MAG: uroporphyrinogen-III synthase [Gemmatimonadota bacterium]
MTRPQEREEREGGRLSVMLTAAGAEPLRRPVLRVVYPASNGELTRSLRRLLAPGGVERSDQRASGGSPWLFVTSPRAVRPVVDALAGGGYGWDGLREKGVRVAAVGHSTAGALQRAGAHVDLVPGRHSGGDLLKEFAAAFGSSNRTPLHGLRILLPRAGEASEELPRGLRALGASLDVVTVYSLAPDERVADSLAQEVGTGDVDVVTLTSGSAAQAVARGMQRSGFTTGELERHTRVVVLGPVTASAAHELGVRVDAVAPVATFQSLVETVMAFR